VRFVWNAQKAVTNRAKHEVTFEEASTVFGDPLAATIPDPEHSQDEARSVTMGHSVNGVLLVVVHADHGEETRLISARRATAGEKKKYEESEKKRT
jgi:uncharacterized DUF497 family protein